MKSILVLLNLFGCALISATIAWSECSVLINVSSGKLNDLDLLSTVSFPSGLTV